MGSRHLSLVKCCVVLSGLLLALGCYAPDPGLHPLGAENQGTSIDTSSAFRNANVSIGISSPTAPGSNFDSMYVSISVADSLGRPLEHAQVEVASQIGTIVVPANTDRVGLVRGVLYVVKPDSGYVLAWISDNPAARDSLWVVFAPQVTDSLIPLDPDTSADTLDSPSLDTNDYSGAHLSLVLSPTYLQGNDIDSALVTVAVSDRGGKPLAGVAIEVSAAGGTIIVGDSSGQTGLLTGLLYVFEPDTVLVRAWLKNFPGVADTALVLRPAPADTTIDTTSQNTGLDTSVVDTASIDTLSFFFSHEGVDHSYCSSRHACPTGSFSSITVSMAASRRRSFATRTGIIA